MRDMYARQPEWEKEPPILPDHLRNVLLAQADIRVAETLKEAACLVGILLVFFLLCFF